MNSPRKYTPISFHEKIPSRIDEVDRLCLRIRHLLQTNDLGEYCFSVELLAQYVNGEPVDRTNLFNSKANTLLELPLAGTIAVFLHPESFLSRTAALVRIGTLDCPEELLPLKLLTLFLRFRPSIL